MAVRGPLQSMTPQQIAEKIRSRVTGDDLEVDFRTGAFNNLKRNPLRRLPPLDARLRSIVEPGGWRPNLETRLAKLRAGGPVVA